MPADDLEEFKLTKEEEQEEIIEWNDVAQAVGYLDELKHFYNQPRIALNIVKQAEGKFAGAHLWANRIRLVAKALVEKSKTAKHLEAMAQRAANIVNTTEAELYAQVKLSEELYLSISNGDLKKAEELRQKMLNKAKEIGRNIKILRILEGMEEKLERHFII